MSAHTHPQFFVDIHNVFGFLLISGGLTRIVEIMSKGVQLGDIHVPLPVAILSNLLIVQFLLYASMNRREFSS